MTIELGILILTYNRKIKESKDSFGFFVGSQVEESIKKIDGDLNDAVAFQRKNFGELRNKDKRLDENIIQLSNVDKAIRSEIQQVERDINMIKNSMIRG